jgi:RHS repeat-associated protein
VGFAGSATSGLYYYGYRFYDPYLQRWVNRDPIGEEGIPNLFRFVGHDPYGTVDALGLKDEKWPPPPADLPGTPPEKRDQDWVLKCLVYCDLLCSKAPGNKKCFETCALDYCDKHKVPDPMVILTPPAAKPGVWASIKAFCKIIRGLRENTEEHHELRN